MSVPKLLTIRPIAVEIYHSKQKMAILWGPSLDGPTNPVPSLFFRFSLSPPYEFSHIESHSYNYVYFYSNPEIFVLVLQSFPFWVMGNKPVSDSPGTYIINGNTVNKLTSLSQESHQSPLFQLLPLHSQL